MSLTLEQQTLLAVALSGRGIILATSADSPNDIVWMDLVEDGVLEMVDRDDPDWASLKNNLRLRGYRATNRAIGIYRKLHPVTLEPMQAGGSA